MRTRFSALSMFLILVLASGCDVSGPVTYRKEVFVRSDELAHVPDALQSAIDSFVGGGGSSVVSQIPSDFLTNSDGAASGGGSSRRVSYSTARSRRVGGRLSAVQGLGNGFSLVTSGTLAYGESNYLLPDGAGVHVQPIGIEFRAVSSDVDALLSHESRLFGRIPVSVGGGGGMHFAHTRTRIDSPILIVRENSGQSLPYGLLRFAIGAPESRGATLGAALELRYYDDIGPTGAIEIGARF